ncbi:MAG: two-component regulator propeller domain-containing protein [Chitinophagaceae bacterium]
MMTPLLLSRVHKFLVTLALMGTTVITAQPPSYNFRHLTTSNGLSDGLVRAVSQDQYGFTWFGTSYGLNRFDGISVKTFFSKPGDKASLPNNYIQSLYADKKRGLWVGTYTGLCRYDYSSNQFVTYSSTKNVQVLAIKADKRGDIWLATTDGLWITDQKNNSIHKYTRGGDSAFIKLFNSIIYQVTETPDGKWYFATNSGIKMFNPGTLDYDEIRHDPSDSTSLSGDIIFTIAADKRGYLWAGSAYPRAMLNRLDLKTKKVKAYSYFSSPLKNWTSNQIQSILCDSKGRLWVASAYSGLSLYNAKTETFFDYKHDPLIPNSLLTDKVVSLYQDPIGIIWIGSPGYGLSYFNPDENIFYNLHPALDKENSLPDIWSRAAAEDQQGNYWLATGKGVAKYEPATRKYTLFANEDSRKPMIHMNSIRSVLVDDRNAVWIGTAAGLNRFDQATGHMDFFTEKQGIPLAFFWMMTQDKRGNIWLGSTAGLYRYDRERNRFDDLRNDSLFSPYAGRNVQAIFTDSRNRLWIGLLNTGVVMYDLEKKRIDLLTVKDSLVSDTRTSSFAEDKKGILWIGSEEGLTAYNPELHTARFYSKGDGLPSGRTNNLLVDKQDRLWFGTSNGLCMMEAERNHIRRFDTNDGLLTNQFNEQAAYATSKGVFIYPSYEGFLLFDPVEYKERKTAPPIYITSFKVSDKEITPGINPEELQHIRLRNNQNFFSISLAGLHYMNPFECTYVYKLEPFDKDWIYTQKREINYTNVPAGTYHFRYKAMIEGRGEDIPEKQVTITIRQLFYKSWWFRLIVVLAVLAGIIVFYRYRLYQREKILLLESKAQLLEKEKTLVMYESLKQHLNPHFLFNSLTALRSLIKTDTKTAAFFLDGMSKIYRYVLKSGEQEVILLQEELDFVKTFVELQKIRFKEGLIVNIGINESLYNNYIVPVTLQNLVENAIKHNTAGEDSPLVIDIFSENDFVVVRNNLQRFRIVETSNKQGLTSLQSLYRFYSDTPLVIQEDGKFFTVKIPLL